jgi:hypothetical protein
MQETDSATLRCAGKDAGRCSQAIIVRSLIQESVVRNTIGEKSSTSGIERVFHILATIAIVAFAIFACAYALKFGLPVHFAWSKDPEDWEHFGAYLGGVLGPIYGLLAFIGVLITIVLQRQQIDDLHAQSTQQPIQQMLGTISGTIDTILRGPPSRKPPETFDFLKKHTDSVSVQTFLRVGANMVAGLDKPPSEEELLHADWVPAIKRLIYFEASDIASKLNQLVACLDAYDAAGGPTAIEDLYTGHYASIVDDLFALDVDLPSRVAKHFGIKNDQNALPSAPVG